MVWLYGEPTLDEALSDPVVRAMMRRDGIDPKALRELIEWVQARRALTPKVPRRRRAEARRDLILSR